MSKDTLAAVTGGIVSAVLYVSVVSWTAVAALLTCFAPLPLFAVGLGLGLRAALIATVVAIVAVAALGGAVAGVAYGAVYAVPVVLVVRQALLARSRPDGGLEWYPVGLLVAGMTLLCAILFGVAAALVGSGQAGLEGTIRSFLSDAIGTIEPQAPVAERGTLVDRLAPLFPAAVMVFWLAMVAINGVLAQGVLMRFGRNLRPAPELGGLEVPVWVPYALAGAGIAALALDGSTLGYMGQNLVVILAVPYLFQGLAVIHALVRLGPAPPLVLVLLYVFLLVVPLSMVLLAGLGFVEQWARLRQRFAEAGPGKEEE